MPQNCGGVPTLTTHEKPRVSMWVCASVGVVCASVRGVCLHLYVSVCGVSGCVHLGMCLVRVWYVYAACRCVWRICASVCMYQGCVACVCVCVHVRLRGSSSTAPA